MNPQEGMPAPTPDVPIQPAGTQTAVGQNQHEPIVGNAIGYLAEQSLPVRLPGLLLMRRQDLPGKKDGAAR